MKRLEARAMEVLYELHCKRGLVVTKDALIEAVWKRCAVTDHAVTVVISELRNALGDDSRNPSYIETIPKRGYRLIADTNVEKDQPLAALSKIHFFKRAQGPVLALAALCLALSLSWFAFAPGNASALSEKIILVDTDNMTNRSDFDSLANSLSAIALDVSIKQEGLSIIRWRRHSVEETGVAKWILESQLLDTEAGPTSAIQILKADTRQIVWNGSVQITSDRFSKAYSALVAQALSAIGVVVDTTIVQSADQAVDDMY